jgi:hypothetical protein
MPPKKANNANAGGKAAQKAKQKVVEDKTFGLKNKNKSAKVQKYVQQVQSQATTSTARKPVRSPTFSISYHLILRNNPQMYSSDDDD